MSVERVEINLFVSLPDCRGDEMNSIPTFLIPFVVLGQKEIVMIEAIIVLAVIALVAALLGFRGIAGLTAGLAKILLVVFLVLVLLAIPVETARRVVAGNAGFFRWIARPNLVS